MDFVSIEQKALLNAKRPLPPIVVANLREHLLVDWTYHSNAIEGNTLTLSETKVVLEGITIGGKSLREHFEVINHVEAIALVEELVSQGTIIREFVISSFAPPSFCAYSSICRRKWSNGSFVNESEFGAAWVSARSDSRSRPDPIFLSPSYS
jgi:hypothetical protein